MLFADRPSPIRTHSLGALALCFCLLNLNAAAQPPAAPPQQTPPATRQQQPPPTPTPAADPEEVIRVSTDLVQTDVMVFDRQGRFVEGLQREQFELRVDGRAQEISFFEQVRAGTANEDAQLAAARGRGAGASGARPLDRGRTIFFFVDDLHLSPGSSMRARRALTHFIESEMGQNDQVAITSASGQIGFLQQITDNKSVLRAATTRITARAQTGDLLERPPMSEHQAHIIENRQDRDLFEYFVTELLRDNRFMTRQQAEIMIERRARQIVAQATNVTRATLSSLESLIRSAARLPGRKVIFFMSDGFNLDYRNSDTTARMRRITDAGARSGVVIYSMDTRGLATQPSFEASRQAPFDPYGVVARSDATELSASQEPLHTLAADSGGRALLNTNALAAAIPRTLQETSVYYLLAWTPERAEQRSNRFRRIEVRVKDRPDLTVRVRSGFFEQAPAEPTPARPARAAAASGDSAHVVALREAINSVYPATVLPTTLAAGFLYQPDGKTVVTASVQLEKEALQFAPVGGATNAIVHVATLIYNDQGNVISSVAQQLTITPPAAAAGQRLMYSHQFEIPQPGLYQVRVAARDSRSGRVGSDTQWIEIPDLARGSFALSSLFLGERTDATPAADMPAANENVVASLDRRFARASRLRFLTFIYNAARSAGQPPDVAMQVQVFRDDQPVITTPLSRLSAEGATDLARIPYAAEIRLENLPAGRYALQVTAIDRAARASSSQRVNFDIY